MEGTGIIPSNKSALQSENASHRVPQENITFSLYYQHSTPVAAMFILAYIFIFLMCMVGNMLVCFIVLKNRQMRTVTNMFILNLAISDLLVGIFCMPTTLVDNLITDHAAASLMDQHIADQACYQWMLACISQGSEICSGDEEMLFDRYRFADALPPEATRKGGEGSLKGDDLLLGVADGVQESIDVDPVVGKAAGSWVDIEAGQMGNPLMNQGKKKKWDLPQEAASAALVGEALRRIESKEALKESVVHWFRCIVYPFRQKLTLRKAIITIFVIWVLALIIMCPSAVTLTLTREEFHFMVDDYNNSYPLYSCWEAWPDKEMRKVYTTVLFSHIYLAPLTLIVIMYARIAFKLFKSSAPIRGSQSEENEGRRVSKRKVKVINMLIIVALFFTLSWLPLWTLMLLTDYGKLSDHQLNLITVYIFPFAHWLAFFNSSVNPIIYGYFNENFRRGFQEAFKVQFCSTRREHRVTYSERNNSGMLFGVRNRIFIEVQPSDLMPASDSGQNNPTKSGLFSLRTGKVAHHGLMVEDLDNKGNVSIPAWDI
ncbi:neuropeptide FF receptor 1 [Rhinatrema bivittatum]|uniref:neuropeptide FF receptor 1 n=1 Tax=Rhinatrema bivittatum TaxID=194408 RepID=UPI001129A12D|nr:neuropeptide FF receptor 1 [Rhinatrema bivittatum]